MAIAYLYNEAVLARIQAGKTFQKSAKTGLRRPIMAKELGNLFPTYVKDGDTIRKESDNVVKEDHIVARNPDRISDINRVSCYNEWLIPEATAIKNYGQTVIDGLSSEFTYHRKSATIQAIPLTDEIMTLLGVTGDVLEIEVSWSPEPMRAKVGDYLTSSGYSISAHDMAGYAPVD